MRYVRPVSALFLSAMLAGAAWAQDADKKNSTSKDGDKEMAAESDKGDRPERPRLEEMRKRILEKFDADKDGKLNDEERTKAREYRHEHADEFAPERGDRERPRGTRPPRGREGRGPEGRRPEGGPGGPGHDGPRMAMRLFDQFDKDGNGQLSRDEFERLAARMHELVPPGPRPGGPGHPGLRDRRRPGGPDDGRGADHERRPPRPREDGERGPEHRRPRPPREDEDHEYERADRPHRPERDDGGAKAEKPKSEDKSDDKSTI